MTIEMANRLVALRKKHGLSQEELAEKLGISRQAVSKWERAEASPDTDNLILLSRLYGVTLDEMLFSDPAAETEEEETDAPQEEEETRERVTVSFKDGIHVQGKNGEEVHIEGCRIHVQEKNGDEVHVTPGHVYVCDADGEEIHFGSDRDRRDMRDMRRFAIRWSVFPMSALCTVLFFVWGFYGKEFGGWSCSWLSFLLIPIYHSAVSAIVHRRPQRFAFPVLVTLVYLLLGYWYGWWHPGWLLFFTIPLYYTVIEAIRKRSWNIVCFPVIATAAFFILGFGWGLWHPGWLVFFTIPLYYGIVNMFRGKPDPFAWDDNDEDDDDDDE